MIQEYLNNQLIQTTADADFDKLKKTCAELGKKISKDTEQVFSLALVAFDPNIDPKNKIITQVGQAIIENWSTFIANSKDTMLTVIRAVILEALQIASENDNNAVLIWFAARNVIKYYKLGREEKVLTSFLLQLANKLEKKVSTEWDFPPDAEIEIPKIPAAAIDATELAAQINNGAGMADILNKSLKKQMSEIKESQKRLLQRQSLMLMRTQLLWWKEAAYSPALHKSYVGLDSGLLQVVLAKDYADLVPKMYPRSVDFFLREVHKGLSKEKEGEKMKIVDFLKLLEKHSEDLKPLLIDEEIEDDTRVSLGTFIKRLVYGKVQIKQFKALVGIPETVDTTLSELTVWLFHDLHTLQLSINN